MQMNTLNDWLAYAEQLHPAGIALGLDRVRRVAERLDLRLTCPVITVAGTNGKGSTCAMLEAVLQRSGWRCGVYTSPHLIRFEERCRIGGEVIDGAALLPHFEAVERARTGADRADGSEAVELTYYEFTTLAILRLMAQSGIDVAVLEVGLGGRLDAVNIIDADCAVITSIDLDHMEYLGADRESIGFEKAGIMRAGRPVVVSDPLPPTSIEQHANAIGADLWLAGRDFSLTGVAGSERLQWGWSASAERGGRRYSGLAYPALRGANQLVNAAGVLAALTAMRERLPVSAQALRGGLSLVELPGRFQLLPGQPAVVLDVAHNPHAVAALTANLDAMGFYPVTHAVFGAMADKDLPTMLRRIGPLVDRWYFCDLPTPRAAKSGDLKVMFDALDNPAKATARCFANPLEAYAAAVAESTPADRIIVFGSFVTVGAVMAANGH